MPDDPEILRTHLKITRPSGWIERFAHLVPRDGQSQGRVLDVAAGGGRHARFFRSLGNPVLAVDKNITALQDLADEDHAEILEIDLEDGKAWPFGVGEFAAIVVSNYLFRDHLDALIGSIEPGGVLLYETFARGNEVFNRPRNPDHLLRSGELLDLVRGRLQIVAYEHGIVGEEPAGVKQRICAINDLSRTDRADGDPAPHPFKT